VNLNVKLIVATQKERFCWSV